MRNATSHLCHETVFFTNSNFCAADTFFLKKKQVNNAVLGLFVDVCFGAVLMSLVFFTTPSLCRKFIFFVERRSLNSDI